MLHRLLPVAGLVDRVSQRRYRRIADFLLRRRGVTLHGSPLWISPQTYFDISRPGSIELGDRCVISHGVRLLTHDFSMDRVDERRHGVSEFELSRVAPVRIGAQAFVGMGVMILPGVEIGEGSIVGSGSVVTKSVPPDEVWAGNPARPIASTGEYWDRSRTFYGRGRRRS